jgi:mannosyltransferase OCH1-like enzyme
MLSDCFRYLILYLEGGIYTDADCEPLKHIDDIFTNTYYCGNNSNNFFIYPDNMKLITSECDFYKNPCDHYKYIKTKQNGIIQYKCLGHRIQKNTNIILGKEYFEEPQFYNSNINNTRLAQIFMISKPKQQIFLECYKNCIHNIRDRYHYIIQLTDKEEYLKEV